jgi:hypothetical protein
MASQLTRALIPPKGADDHDRMGGIVELLMEHMELARQKELEVSLHFLLLVHVSGSLQ